MKKIVIIILVIFSLALVSIGIVLSVKKGDENQLPKTPQNITSYSEKQARELAEQLYKTDEADVEVTTTEDGNYEITVKDNKTEEVKNTFVMDKKTGVVSEVTKSPQIVTGPIY